MCSKLMFINITIRNLTFNDIYVGNPSQSGVSDIYSLNWSSVINPRSKEKNSSDQLMTRTSTDETSVPNRRKSKVIPYINSATELIRRYCLSLIPNFLIVYVSMNKSVQLYDERVRIQKYLHLFVYPVVLSDIKLSVVSKLIIINEINTVIISRYTNTYS